VTDDVLSDIVSTSVLILINAYYKADPLTSKPGSTGCIAQPRRSRMKPSTSCGDGCARLTASWLSSGGSAAALPLLVEHSQISGLGGRD
jgi:hypothetical protein